MITRPTRSEPEREGQADRRRLYEFAAPARSNCV